MRLIDVEAQIEDALQALCPISKTEGWDTPRWTKEVTLALASVGEKLGFRSYSRAHPGRGEWLWDLTWIQGQEGFTEDIGLVLESEWGNPEDVSNDFQKLMPARADHRVMVFQASDGNGADARVNALLQEVGRYRQKQPGDRYLFACWLSNHNQFWFHRYVV